MSEDTKIKMLEVAKILFLNEVPKEQSEYIGSFIEELNGEVQRLESQLEWYDRTLEEKQKEITKRDKILKEVREYVRSNEWAKDYEKSSCRTHILEILDKENK